MDFHSLTQKISQQLIDRLPFVAYSMPQSKNVTALLQKNEQLKAVQEFNTDGFVFAPFDYKDAAFFIAEQDAEKFESGLIDTEINFTMVPIEESSAENEEYLAVVQKAIETIKTRKYSKIVISRYKDFRLNNFSIETLINRLFSAYPAAFRYIWYHPKTGIWCGATPETLVLVEGESFKTMALAGTQPFKNQRTTEWGAKELNEQQLVTDAITKSLQRVTSVLKVSNPQTHRAGPLLHLRTDISGIMKSGKATLTKIVAALHPTPAVCGTPQHIAKEFILQNEGYQRGFYTGFLGPIQKNGSTASLMVNLRCMKIENNTARIFGGGGITIGSNPTDEWIETQNKIQVMLQVLRPFL